MRIATANKPTSTKPARAGGSVLSLIWEVVRESGLQVGDQLPSIRELADRLQVKQSTVRDALLKAEAMGLVKVLPRAGAFLQSMATAPVVTASVLEESLPGVFHSALVQDEQNLFHLLDARRLIEIEMAGRAAERRQLEDLLPVRRALENMLQMPVNAPRADYVSFDVRFHIEIARLSGNHALFGVQRTLMELLRSYIIEVPNWPLRRAPTEKSHVAIYEALVAGDGERARKEMRAHLNLAYDSLLQNLQESPIIGHP